MEISCTGHDPCYRPGRTHDPCDSCACVWESGVARSSSVSLYSGKCSCVQENTGTKKCVKEHTKTPHDENEGRFLYFGDKRSCKEKNENKDFEHTTIPWVRIMYESFKVNDGNMVVLSCCCCVHWL